MAHIYIIKQENWNVIALEAEDESPRYDATYHRKRSTTEEKYAQQVSI